MHNLKRFCLAAIAIACLVATLLCASGCGSSSSKETGLIKSVTYSTYADFNFDEKKVGFLSGTLFDQFLQENYPRAEKYYYNSTADAFAALQAGKIDALLYDYPLAQYAALSIPGFAYIDNPVFTTGICFVFPKDEDGAYLQQQFNVFLENIEKNGTLSALRSKWLSGPILDDTIDNFSNIPATNGVLKFATSATSAPVTYVSNGEYTGFEMEIAAMFCREYGYGLEVMDMTFDGFLATMSSGKADFGASSASYSEERAKTMLFSNPTFACDGVVVYQRTEEDSKEANTKITSLVELDGKNVGYQVGSVCEDSAIVVAGGSGEVLGFNSAADLAAALNARKIDGYLIDSSLAGYLLSENEDQVSIGETGKQFPTAAIVNSDNAFGEVVKGLLDAWIAQAKSNGSLDDLIEKWMSGNYDAKMSVDVASLPATNGTINVAVSTATGAPHCFLRNGKYVGFDVEIMALVAQANGYALEFYDFDFSGSLAAVSSGKCDIGVGGIIVTEERKKSFDFSDVYYTNVEKCIVLDNTTGSASVWKSIVQSFKRTFVEEGRWSLFISGILTTLLITFCSLIFGTLIGFLVFRLCYARGRIVNRITDFCVWLITGMPTVVLLMILFYVIFGATSVDGVTVSIVGFSLIFAAAVIGMFRVGCSAVDDGEIEAAKAMGFSKGQIFNRIILPQAVYHMLSVYRSETITLLKGTAIVGYIAVQDLTKVGDIIRARTYEAFFPLIAIAVFYFVIAGVLKLVINVVAKRFDPHNRTADQVYKGVKRR